MAANDNRLTDDDDQLTDDPFANTEPPLSVFHTYSTAMITAVEIAGRNSKLLPHQRHALMQLEASLPILTPDIPFIFELPTGTGKSVLILLTPYYFQSRSVLILTPSSLISRQIAEDFSGNPKAKIIKEQLPKLMQLQIVSPALRGTPRFPLCKPQLITNTKDLEFRSVWESAVIANAHKFGANSGVSIYDLPPDRFDLIIVDEAHHYPARTWQMILEHFSSARKVFVTATRTIGRGRRLWPDRPSYTLPREAAIRNQLIRDIDYVPVDGDPELDSVIHRMHQLLNEADVTIKSWDWAKEHHRRYFAQGMILAQGVSNDQPGYVRNIVERYNELYPGQCDSFLAGDHDMKRKQFKKGNRFRVVVVIGRMLEGFDHPHVCVTAIIRNVVSPVLFTQFLGRSVRLIRPHEREPMRAKLIAHVSRHQNLNVENFITPIVSEADAEDSEDENAAFFLFSS